jgi:hypothetical protein
MLREKLKKVIDKLRSEQFKKFSDLIAAQEFESTEVETSHPLWKKLTPTQRDQEFREWVSQLPKSGVSLSDEAINRDSIYEE